jgi:hypothetical protein
MYMPPVTVQSIIHGMYISMFGRTSDANGYPYWVAQFGSTTTLAPISTFVRSSAATLAQDFYNDTSTYFNSVYGGLTDTQFVTAVYENLGNAPPDSGGLAFWLTQIPIYNRPQVVGYISNDLITGDFAGNSPGLSVPDYTTAVSRQLAFLSKIRISELYAGNPAPILISNAIGDPAFLAQQRAIKNAATTQHVINVAVQIIQAVSANNLALIVGN